MRSARALVVALSALSTLSASCARPRAPEPTRTSWSYDVVAGPGGRELTVEARLSRGSPQELSVDSLAEAFVRDVEVEQDGAFVKVPMQGNSWFVPACTRFGCRVRYRFLLAEAARSIDDLDRAVAYDDAYLAPPSTWLLYPQSKTPLSGAWSLRVRGTDDAAFVTGLFRDGRGGYAADVSDLPDSPYSAFGKLRVRKLSAPGGEVDVAFGPGDLGLPEADVLAWVDTSVQAVASYYERFPVQRALVMVMPQRGRGVFGKTLGNGGASIIITYGRDTTKEDLAEDWIMPHELIHLAFPSLARQHSWLEEGLSTYVEPLVRVRRKMIAPEDVWRDLAFGLPQGQPEAGDQGLDRTPTWGRTYWGGALFCLTADVEIRRATQNRRSLGDALREIVRRGGNVAVRRPIEDTLRIGDDATGTTVLTELYRQWANTPVRVDLPHLWRELGISIRGGAVRLSDDAPLAFVRRGIEGDGER